MTQRMNIQNLPPLPPLVPGGDATRPSPSREPVGNIMSWIAVLLCNVSWICMMVMGEVFLPGGVGMFIVALILVAIAGKRYSRFLREELQTLPVGTVTATVSSRGLMGRNDLGRAGFLTFAIPQNCTSFTFLVKKKVYKQLHVSDRVVLTYQGWEILSFTPAPASESENH